MNEQFLNQSNRIALFVIAVFCLIGSLPTISLVLEYQGSWIVEREYWRPMTAWIAQLNFKHWLMNMWGIGVMALLLPSRANTRDWLGLAVITLCASLLLLTSKYDQYVGLSGVLYGYLVWLAVISPFYSNSIKALFLVVLSSKVIVENGWIPFAPEFLVSEAWVATFIQGTVAVESHLWGLMSGWLVVIGYWLFSQIRSKTLHRD